jgi:uncharacterized C2H2 Zn-finger protein
VEVPHLVWATWLQLRPASELFLCPRCYAPFTRQRDVSRHRQNRSLCRHLGKS